MAGTQAENIIDNHIVVSKMFSLCKTQYDDDPEEAEPDDYDQEAKIVYDTIPHHGAVNRIRVGFSLSIQCAVPSRQTADRGRVVGPGHRKHLQHRASAVRP